MVINNVRTEATRLDTGASLKRPKHIRATGLGYVGDRKTYAILSQNIVATAIEKIGLCVCYEVHMEWYVHAYTANVYNLIYTPPTELWSSNIIDRVAE